MIGSYYVLQLKRCLKSGLRALALILITLIIFLAVVFGVSEAFKETGFSPVKIGISIPKEEEATRFVTDYIESMDSVKSICSFEYLDEDEGKEKLAGNRIKALIVIPSGFYHDVQVGINTPASIYVNNSGDFGTMIFKELLISGVSFLQICQAAVYAKTDTAIAFGSKLSIEEIGNATSLEYVDEILSRKKMFVTREVSSFGEISMSNYYFLAGLILVLMFLGIIFNRMYTVENQALEDKLRINGIGTLKACMIKILVMVPILYSVGLLLLLAGRVISVNYKIPMVGEMGCYLLPLLAISLLISIYFQIIFGVTRDNKSGILVLIILNVTGALCSGLFIPEVYMARWTNIISCIFPVKYWFSMMINGIGGGLI